jgi:hypothetical protein
MINYLMQQLNSFEQLVTNSSKRVSDLQERDRDSLLKVRNDLKYQNDVSLQTINDLVTKVAMLDQNMRNDEILRNELRQKLRSSEE